MAIIDLSDFASNRRTVEPPNWSEIAERFACTNHVVNIRRRVYRNGQITWWEQCQTCGEKFKNLKTVDVPSSIISNPVDFDEEVAKRRSDAISAAYEAARAAYRDAEAAKETAWWADYHRYLLTPEWGARSAKVIKRANGICECCGEPANRFHVHHKTYKNLKNEPLWDLAAVCVPCHKAIHPHMGAA